ncbi:Major centromere autoantigen B [Phytophthora ramorum]|uniref:Major centromere autoantigen B n=1 Tax=Phytophthora ramorum TaxID=164328 RepID=UPI0030B26D77|nr:Major centromere autoantigen B [Phytophthora ramorum]
MAEHLASQHENDSLPVRPGLPLGRRMRLTLGQKREVVDLAASKKFTHRELAEKFRVGRTTITNICRQEELIRSETDSADAAKKKRKTTKCTYDLRVLDESLHKWRMEVKVSSPDTKLTGTVLQHKAMELACKMADDPYAALPDKVKQALHKFTGSNGWLDGYRTRFGSFSSKQLPGGGDQSVIKSVDIQTRLRELHHSFMNVQLEDIWTASEFAVMYKPPAPVSDGSAAGSNNGRYTVSLFVSAAGEKFDMQVIGMDRNPLLLEGIDTKETYKIQYGYSKTGWQVAQTTVSMLKSLNALARERKRTFRVVLDSAVPHVKAAMILDSQGDQRTFFVYDHLQIYFLPPNFKAPRFHPCHLGVIQAFKARFRSEMLETLFSNYRQSVISQDPRGFHPQRHLHTRNVFHWFNVALRSLDKQLIQTCWVQSGLLPTQAIASLNLRAILSNTSPMSMTPNTSTGSGSDSGNGGANSDVNGMTPNGASGAGSTVVAHATQGGLLSPAVLYRDLQLQLTNIAQLAPDFLRWIGVSDPSNAQAFVELEGNASVTDPGIDEVQIIRGVLQKHGYLSTKKLDDESHAEGPYETFDDVADEPCPRHDEVVASIEILKKYLRLSRDAIPDRVDAVVQLNQVKKAINAAAFRDAAIREV